MNLSLGKIILIAFFILCIFLGIFVYFKGKNTSITVPPETNETIGIEVPVGNKQIANTGTENNNKQEQNEPITYKNDKYGFEIKFPGDWKIEEDNILGKYSIKKNSCRFDILNISPEEYVRAIEYTDGKKGTGCVLSYWWQTDNGGFQLDHLKKIACSTNSSAIYYGGYYFQNGEMFFRISAWDEKGEYFDTAAAIPDASKCGAELKAIASGLVLTKKELVYNFIPESGDAKKVTEDGEAYKILKEFGTKLAPVEATDENILLDALAGKDNLKEKLTRVEANFAEAKNKLDNSQETARGVLNVGLKICAAKSIIYNDFKHICGLGEGYYITLDDIDNISVGETVLPYFLAGFAYYKDGDYNRARYFLDQVKLHRRAGILRWGESYFDSGVYVKIFEKTQNTPYVK